MPINSPRADVTTLATPLPSACAEPAHAAYRQTICTRNPHQCCRQCDRQPSPASPHLVPAVSPLYEGHITTRSNSAGQESVAKGARQGWGGRRRARGASKPLHAASHGVAENAPIAAILDAIITYASRRTSATQKTAGIGAATPPNPATGAE